MVDYRELFFKKQAAFRCEFLFRFEGFSHKNGALSDCSEAVRLINGVDFILILIIINLSNF